jgi:hypothetical protein
MKGRLIPKLAFLQRQYTDKLNTGASLQTRNQPYMVEVINSCTGIPGAERRFGSGAEVALSLSLSLSLPGAQEHGPHRWASRCRYSVGSDVVVDPVEPLPSRRPGAEAADRPTRCTIETYWLTGPLRQTSPL